MITSNLYIKQDIYPKLLSLLKKPLLSFV